VRQVVLDTETTGLEPGAGHRIIEIGALEMVNRRLTGRRLHYYLNPERPVEAGAVAVHGLTDEFLADKPRFAQVCEEIVAFLHGAELVIHNAAFDVAFLEAELERAGVAHRIAEACTVLCTLTLARSLHPGQRNSLDALCRRYSVDASARELHGALLDAELLTDVYLAMTGGQATLELGSGARAAAARVALPGQRAPLVVLVPDAAELAAHTDFLARIAKASGDRCAWPGEDAVAMVRTAQSPAG
jgi:DNA polymerase III subunit epsilon